MTWIPSPARELFVLAFLGCGLVLAVRELIVGFRTGQMSTLVDVSPSAPRAEKPIWFWVLAAANFVTIVGALLGLIVLGLPYLTMK